MQSVKFYPTANFGDSFRVFNHLLSYQTLYVSFIIRLYKRGRFAKKLTCDFSGLVEILSSLEFEAYSDVVVFGYPNTDPLDSEILFTIHYDFCTGNRCIRFYQYE